MVSGLLAGASSGPCRDPGEPVPLLSTALPRRTAGPAAAGKWLQTAGECEFVGGDGGSGPREQGEGC